MANETPSPTVKVTPTFKANDKVSIIATGQLTEVLLVTKEGNLRLKGVANLVHPSAVGKA